MIRDITALGNPQQLMPSDYEEVIYDGHKTHSPPPVIDTIEKLKLLRSASFVCRNVVTALTSYKTDKTKESTSALKCPAPEPAYFAMASTIATDDTLIKNVDIKLKKGLYHSAWVQFFDLKDGTKVLDLVENHLLEFYSKPPKHGKKDGRNTAIKERINVFVAIFEKTNDVLFHTVYKQIVLPAIAEGDIDKVNQYLRDLETMARNSQPEQHEGVAEDMDDDEQI